MSKVVTDTPGNADEYKQLLTAIVESSDDAIISKSLDGIVQSWNRGAERLFGYTAAEMIGQSITRLEPAHRRHEMKQILTRLRAGERIDHFQTERVGKNGQIIDISLTVSPIVDSSGRIVAASKIARDISEQKRTEAALRASETRYRALVETQSEMICRFLLDGTILFANEAYARVQASTGECLVGQNFWTYIPIEDHEQFRRRLLDSSPSSPFVRVESRLTTEDGVRWILWANRALEFDPDKRVLEAQATGIDITERKDIEDQLHRIGERKDEFLSTLAHELRNPLAPLRTGIEILMHSTSGQQFGEVISIMDRQTRHLQRIVEDLVDLSRISHGHIELRRSKVNCNTVIASAIELNKPVIDKRQHTLHINVTPEAIWVDGDPDRLIQVVANLLSNAAKYTPSGGAIRVDCNVDDDKAMITVRDNGVGFRPELAESLFDMYARIRQHKNSVVSDGLGVGLPLARQLAELHGGTIVAVSAGIGEGSEFTVTLPLNGGLGTDSEPNPDKHQPELIPSATVPRRVLIVDDNTDAAEALSMLLSHHHHCVEVVHDGEKALHAVQSFKPDRVLLDIGLPGMDGYDTARQMRALPGGDELIIVALTGWGQGDDKQRAREAGFDGHLTKPANIKQLLQVIDNIR